VYSLAFVLMPKVLYLLTNFNRIYVVWSHHSVINVTEEAKLYCLSKITLSHNFDKG